MPGTTRSEPVEVAIRHLASRRRFEREVRAHLRRKGFRAAEIDGAVRRLQELQLLDDDETCRAWIRDRLRFSPRGREHLRAGLVREGVDPARAGAVLDEAYPEASERDVAAQVLRRAADRLGGLTPAVARRRMWSALARRGFGRETCREVIADFFEERGMREDETE
ncbi:MAG: regulatory protein RecX [bacterium]